MDDGSDPIEVAVAQTRKRARAFGVPTETSRRLCTALRKSETMRRLATSGSIDEQMRFRLCLLAVYDVFLDPPTLRAARMLFPAESDDGKLIADAVVRAREAASSLRRVGEDKLADQNDAEADFLEQTIEKRQRGKPKTLAGDLAEAIDRQLASNKDLDDAARRRLIAEIVTEFVEPKRPDQVKWLLRERMRNYRTDAHEGEPVVAFLSTSESVLETAGLIEPKSLRQHENSGPGNSAAHIFRRRTVE